MYYEVNMLIIREEWMLEQLQSLRLCQLEDRVWQLYKC